MALDIHRYPHPFLHTRAEPIKVFNQGIKTLAIGLAQVLQDTGALSVSAPLVGVGLRMVAIRFAGSFPAHEGSVAVFVNPEIVARGAVEGLSNERCLALPGVEHKVLRATSITLKSFDYAGQQREVVADGRDAMVLQHEIDHLDGLLLTDAMTERERRRAEVKMAAAAVGSRLILPRN